MDSARPHDAGTIVMGWLFKVALVLLLFGISAFDAVSVGSAHMTTSDDANSAAASAAAEYQSTHNVDSALKAAEDAITNPNEVLVPGSLSIAADGTATVSVERKVKTLVMYHFGPLKKYTVVKAQGQASPPTS